MDARELLKKITGLNIFAEGLAEEMLSGNFRSLFKGQGVEFDEARHYQWGDDAKNIDWNASARLGATFVKLFKEERELTILILLDCSSSMRNCVSRPFGDEHYNDKHGALSLYEQAVICSALIAFSAERSGLRIGSFLFDSEIHRVLPPRKGKSNVMAIIEGLLQKHESPSKSSRTSNISAAIAGAQRMLKRRSMIVIISDFLSIGWEKNFGSLCRGHDVIAVRVSDTKDNNISDLGLLLIKDPETGIQIHAPTKHSSFKEAWSRQQNDRAKNWKNICQKAGAALLELQVDIDAAAALTRFFSRRSS